MDERDQAEIDAEMEEADFQSATRAAGKRRDLAAIDAAMEANFQRRRAQDKAASKRKRGGRHVGCPLAFVADVCRLTEGRVTLVVALLLYRHTHIRNSGTVTLPRAELAELGISRKSKQRALMALETAGIIRTEKVGRRSVKVTLL
jgi:hypothetical protein